jgi:hypothetical protein
MKQKYYTQRTGARNRGIEWHFTYESWLEWWGTDIVNRGNRSGQLVMARMGDTGPYHPNNVQKITVNQNHSDAHKNGLGFKKHTAESKAKISASGLGIKKPGRKNMPWTEERRAKMIATWAQKKSNTFNPAG